ncbi:hypothetical protein [Nocardia sp. GAS34]|uniref:SbtR family transcriptional regulator n=1 Tax=unclassified Nocardia TaxID=2637762 RepID=UPI003D1B113E
MSYSSAVIECSASPVTPDIATEWVRAAVRHATTYRGLAEVLVHSLFDDGSELHASSLRMNSIGEELVKRAGRAAALGPDATAADLFMLYQRGGLDT